MKTTEKKASTEKDLLNYREDESYIKAQKQLMENFSSISSRQSTNNPSKDLQLKNQPKPTKKPYLTNKIDLTPNEKSNKIPSENLNLSVLSQTTSNPQVNANSFSQYLQKTPCSLNNTIAPGLFELDSLTNNSERKLNNTTTGGFNSNYTNSNINSNNNNSNINTPNNNNTSNIINNNNGSLIQKMKIDLTDQKTKKTSNSNSRAASLTRNMSLDGNKKNPNTINFKKKTNNDTSKNKKPPQQQAFCTYVIVIIKIFIYFYQIK